MALLARISNWFLEVPELAPPALVDPDRAFDELRWGIEAPRRTLLDHRLYTTIDTLPRLRLFMETHVFAVWDFMCLAKRLQRDLTSMEVLWRPPAVPAMARFINGIILGEESDAGPTGEAVSHCELYIDAMEEVGASTRTIRRFLELISQGLDVETALAESGAPRAARSFVRGTLDLVTAGSTVEVLSSFLFGREDLIPDMFQQLLPRWSESRSATRFTYYVQRHIELDGDEHGPAARRALIALAGTDPDAWAHARRAAERSILSRIELWNRIDSKAAVLR
ncbi:MAG: DUF3050 domain-containing protein [Myxococcota bacterium]|nr:DUF3050 domain-containing protein [Myxococcota bacterium]